MKMNNSKNFFLKSGTSKREARVDLRNLLRTENYRNVERSRQGHSNPKILQRKEKVYKPHQGFQSGQ